uniref:SET domain-containing protein n=2 Tax=Kalanchoe fedtschenkoi TaxID=63787 RepID=A0A7N1A2Y0_KALFE
MAFLFKKFQELVQSMAKNITFGKNPRQLQFEADINRLFLYTSYNRLGKDAVETDAEEIIDMATKASVMDQQREVHENIHIQFKNICSALDKILLPDCKKATEYGSSHMQANAASHRSGLSLAIGKSGQPKSSKDVVPGTKALSQFEVSQSFKDHIGYTLDVRASQVPHKQAGQGLFISGQANVGSVIAIYPGVIYSPAYYRYIPGYPRVDSQNPYLITRYDGTVIDAQPWGSGGETREFWDGLAKAEAAYHPMGTSDRLWTMLSKPLEQTRFHVGGEVLDRRNPLAFAHFANHPANGVAPNVMLCPYDFPLTDNNMRVYIPNILYGKAGEVQMRRFGSFYFKWSDSQGRASEIPVLRTIVLVSTRELCDEEIYLNYRLSNTKRRPEWYCSVDEEEDERRWS